MNDRLVKAVAACARTLTGAPDAESALAQTNAATVGALRAFADRFALQRRFHDLGTHHRHRPADPVQATWFDAVEQARLDVLGTRWLPGIARNLVAHPGADDDGIRWLTFEVLSGTAAPANKSALVDRLKASLPATLLEGLRQLRNDMGNQARFSAAAAEWVRAA